MFEKRVLPNYVLIYVSHSMFSSTPMSYRKGTCNLEGENKTGRITEVWEAGCSRREAVANRLHLGTRIYEIWSKDEGCGRRRLSH
jgi:hypothetical protein